MKRKRMKIGVMLALLTVAAQPAVAGPWRDFGGGRFNVQAQSQRPGEFQNPPQQNLRFGKQPPEPGKRGDGKLTDEERRNLRRDIDQANREIYKGQGR